MLPLPIFGLHRPKTVAEAVAMLGELPNARLVAGGTDLLPNMKQGITEPEHLVSLRGVSELTRVALEPDDGAGEHLVVGAGVRLADAAESLLVRRAAPALAEACGAVGGPHHRAMGTVGGNVCLDTRCRWVNQTYFWRKSLGFCLKKDGTVCHVVKGGAKCVAAASNDSAPALIALEAEIEIVGKAGVRRVPASDFWTADGVKNNDLAVDEVVTRVRVPVLAGRKSAFEKLRRRGAIDFPLLSVAARLDFEGDAVRAADVVVSALGAKPRRVRAAAKVGTGAAMATLPEELAAGAFAECKPLTNLDDDAGWRREMVRVYVKKAVSRLMG
ncbi:MAG TPA: FAD binding domain-containing protein [Byssovorax sp.]|jgi:4-hydroxybenzoyl-CoA reductase subunit beta